jgi:cell division septum initiation protein DivIVA
MGDGSTTAHATDLLPVVRRGYERAATDAMVGDLHARLASALAERDEARGRVIQLEQHLAEANVRKQAVADALVLASRVRAEHERETKELLSESLQQAEEILRRARVEAECIVETAGLRSSNLERELRAAGQLADSTRTHLARFVQSLRRLDGATSPEGGGAAPTEQPVGVTTD